MIRFEGFSDYPQTPQAWAGFAVGTQMKMLRAAVSVAANAPAQQMQVAQAMLKAQQDMLGFATPAPVVKPAAPKAAPKKAAAKACGEESRACPKNSREIRAKAGGSTRSQTDCDSRTCKNRRTSGRKSRSNA